MCVPNMVHTVHIISFKPKPTLHPEIVCTHAIKIKHLIKDGKQQPKYFAL